AGALCRQSAVDDQSNATEFSELDYLAGSNGQRFAQRHGDCVLNQVRDVWIVPEAVDRHRAAVDTQGVGIVVGHGHAADGRVGRQVHAGGDGVVLEGDVRQGRAGVVLDADAGVVVGEEDAVGQSQRGAVIDDAPCIVTAVAHFDVIHHVGRVGVAEQDF